MDQEFHKIYEEYGADLYRFIFCLCRNEHLAKDILQDTMLRAVTKADSFKGDCSVKTWLCVIAKNIWYDYLKKRPNSAEPLDTVGETADDNDFESKLADSEISMKIHQLLHKLEEPYREVFTLRVFAELKFSDIGTIFGKSENWAGVTYYRAKQKLIQMLKKENVL
ncbi:MAG: sigma-70 family RNA polymerase sigma factor [Ruminococcus sp.]|nr:sigma-70 family RNA polymerase sigma factor [Ruminococcus sp.]